MKNGRERPAATGGHSPVASARQLQSIWFSLIRREWESLVILPIGQGTGAAELARELAHIGELHRGEPLTVLDCQGRGLGEISRDVISMSEHMASGKKVLVVTDPLEESQASMPVILAADAVLLCVPLGQAKIRAARETAELVGKQRIVGAVTFA